MNFKSVRTSYTTKVVISFLTIQLVFGGVFPTITLALPEGPTQPEFNSFTPIGASDMVDLTSGDFNYSIPVMDVGGYPLSLGYSSSTNFDSPSSWVGHGWDLSAGQINRSMRVIPDDFNGTDQITTQNSQKDNTTVTVGHNFNISTFGFDLPKGAKLGASMGLAVTFNNYTGMSLQPSFGPSFGVHENFNSSINFSPSSTEGVSINPQAAFSNEKDSKETGVGLNFNSFSKSLSVNSSMSSLVKKKESDQGKSLGGNLNVLDFKPAQFNPGYQLGFTNLAGTVNLGFGASFFGIDGKAESYASVSNQALKSEYKNKKHAAYGYNNNYLVTGSNGMRDFSRSNDRTITAGISNLSVPQNTYDYYSISGQGISGSFRPQNAQVGYMYDPKVVNTSKDFKVGFEAAGGNLFKVGGNISASFNDSHSGYWKQNRGNTSHNFLSPIEDPILNNNYPANFKRNFFKFIGENTLENKVESPNQFIQSIGDKNPVYFKRSPGWSYKNIDNRYTSSDLNFTSPVSSSTPNLVMKETVPTSKTITAVSVEDYYENNNYAPIVGNDVNYAALNKSFDLGGLYGGSANIARNHHQSGFKLTDDGGVIYNYDLPLYTRNSSQISFSVSKNAAKSFSNSQVSYSNQDNSPNNRQGRDYFYEKRTIDPYVHTSLLRSILSPDYRDKTSNGLSPDDLGSYTLFKYKKSDGLFPYRLPVEQNEAFYRQGTISSHGDDKASITYGEKEQAFLERIITKTHVAYFELNNDNITIGQNSRRKDNLSSTGENGGNDSSKRSRYLSKIHLYTLAQAEAIGLLRDDISSFNPSAYKSLKTAHFEYDYSLQKKTSGKGLPNSEPGNGKLTLKKVYFTYGSSKMGMYTPYQFKYNQDDSFEYHNLNKDTWGNYMPNRAEYSITGTPNNAEFPYTDQNEADDNARKFLLSEITLPSGGNIKVNYEADDYSYVQNKKTMKMFNIVGVGSDISTANYSNQLYQGVSIVNDVLYLDVNDDLAWSAMSNDVERLEFAKSKYLNGIQNDPIFFKIMSNINNNQNRFKEYITGFVYLEDINDSNNLRVVKNDSTNRYYIAVRVQKPKLNGGSGDRVHPFSKAVWNYSNAYLKSIAFNGEDNYVGELDPEQAARSLMGNIGSVFSMFTGPNRKLRSKGCGKELVTSKSWLRLNEPTGFKKGGGARVSSVLVDSNWDLMTTSSTSSSETNYYGQEYSYTSSDGSSSSGVAVNEPEQSDDNPLKIPVEDRSSRTPSGDNTSRLIDKFLAPMNSNYLVGPLLSDYYPSPQVTYSRVTVKNRKPDYIDPNNANLQISSRATGSVVNEFYTSKDFPTIEKNSVLDSDIDQDSNVKDFIEALVGFPADINSKEYFIGTQGFYVETNDMNGKPKSQTVYAEKAIGNNFITKSITKYQQDENGQLDNTSVFIDKSGKIIEQEVGVEYDIVNDFRFSHSETYTSYLDANLASFFIFIAPVGVPMGIPGGSRHLTQSRMATTAKHVHRAGVVKSTTVIDNGSSITTENVAFDYYSRQPIVRKVNNEFNDVIYNFDYPAYWLIDEMGNKSINEGMTFKFSEIATADRYKFTKDAFEDGMPLLLNGDELKISGITENVWVQNIAYGSGPGATTFDLINKEGEYVPLTGNDTATVVRSAYDNKQVQSVASISMSKNPIAATNGTLNTQLPDFFDEDYHIYNASAIEMKSLWEPDCECGYDKLPRDTAGNIYFDELGSEINPYANNILGQYRPWKSRAYLTGREKVNMSQDQVNLRRDGFYREFFPFYRFEGTGQDRKLTLPNFDSSNPVDVSYQAKHDRWQFASEVSKISPYGLELENKDPLKNARYSSAMYGFNKKFPTAVASNTEYRELAFDGFEDYDYIEHDDEHFAFAKALYHTQNPDGTYTQNDTITWRSHITNKEHHTGNYAMALKPTQSIGVNQTLIECRSVDVGNLYLQLIDYIWNHPEEFDESRCHPNPMAIPEFAALSPYIISQTGEAPSICDFASYTLYTHIVDEDNNTIVDYNVPPYQGAIHFNFYPDNSIPFPNNYDNRENPNGINQVPVSNSQGNYFLPCSNQADSIQPNTALQLQNFQRAQSSSTSSGIYLWSSPVVDFCEKISTYSDIFFPENKCIDCTSFSPHQGYDYVVSSWVKEEIDRSNLNTPQQLRDAYPTTYDNTSVSIAFADVNGTSVGTPLQFNFKPSGQIINGWQKVYGTFRVDSNANIMKVLLNNNSSNANAFFDDVRIHPVNGSMKSFVYDDSNFRLRAELDDNNYATFYEYDLEGNLIRIKKETSRGIMTIQESRQSLFKNITP